MCRIDSPSMLRLFCGLKCSGEDGAPIITNYALEDGSQQPLLAGVALEGLSQGGQDGPVMLTNVASLEPVCWIIDTIQVGTMPLHPGTKLADT